MKIWSMTVKKLEALKNEANKIKNKIEMLRVQNIEGFMEGRLR